LLFPVVSHLTTLQMMHKLKIPIIGTSAGELQASIKALPDDIRFLVEDLAARTLQPAECVISDTPLTISCLMFEINL